MTSRKSAVATSMALAPGSLGMVNTASAVTFTFQNNATATQPGAMNLAFDAGSEFHLATPSATSLSDGDRDVIFGGEQWIFNGNASGALMTKVANTDTNSGHSGNNGSAFLTNGITGLPIASTSGTVATLHQNFNALGAVYSILAPLTGNIVGQTFGAASLDVGSTNNFSQAGTFSIHMPVIYVQWADGTYVLGGDGDGDATGQHGLLPCSPNGPCPGPGVTFHGTTDGSGNFALWASHQLTSDEITVGSFRKNNAEWSLQGTYATSAVPVPAAAWLLGSGLAGLVGVARRRRNNLQC